MTSVLAGPALVFAAVAVAAAPASAAAPDLSWIVDGELQSRAALARSQADTLEARAAAADTERAMLTGRRDGARAERDGLAPTLETLSRMKRGLAESRIKELDGLIAGWETRIGSLERQAQAARKDAETRRAFAASVDQEAATRTRQEADAVPLGADDIAALPDARLRAAKAFYARRKGRVPAQIAAIERMTRDPATTSSARAALVGQTAEVRAGTAEDDVVVALIDEELRFRAESRDDEGRQAAELERAALAKAAQGETPSLVLSTARSAELDVALDRIIAREDQAARKAKQRNRTWSVVVRWSLGSIVLAAMGGLLWFVAFRGATPKSGGRRQ